MPWKETDSVKEQVKCVLEWEEALGRRQRTAERFLARESTMPSQSYAASLEFSRQIPPSISAILSVEELEMPEHVALLGDSIRLRLRGLP